MSSIAHGSLIEKVLGESGGAFPEPGAVPRYPPSRGCRALRLDIVFRFDHPTGEVETETTVSLGPQPCGTFEPSLDLDDSVSVEAVEDAESGAALPWRHTDGRLQVGGLAAAGGRVRVRARARPARGVYFTGPKPEHPTRAPLLWTQCQDEDAHHFIPCHDHPGARQPFTVRVEAPAGWQVVGNGRLLGEERLANGQYAWTWVQDEPVPIYLLSVVAGAFTVWEDVAQVEGRPVPLRALAPSADVAGDPAMLGRIFGETRAMVEFLSARFGVAYPWPRYDQVVVHDFIFGGMENVTATTLTDLVLTPAALHAEWDARDLIVHELAHQWFGDLVTCEDWSQAWLNEGWATWSEVLWKRHHEGEDEATWDLWGKLGDYLGEDAGRYRRALVQNRYKAPIDLFDRHLYEKAALVLHTLETTLGAGPFWAGVRGYLDSHAFSGVHTRDFQRSLEHATGRSLGAFFDQWVYAPGHPSLEVTLGVEGGQLSVGVRQTQSGDGVPDAYTFPLTLGICRGGDTQRVTLSIDSRDRTFILPLQSPPDRVEVDPDFSLLADLHLKGPLSLLCASLTGDPRPTGRVRAGQALLATGGRKARDAVFAAVAADGFWGVRAALLTAAAKLPTADVAVLAAARLQHDPSPRVRKAAASTLGECPKAVALPVLAPLGPRAGGDSILVEAELIKARVRHGAPGARADAEAALGRDAWGDTLRMRALEGLGASRDASVLPLLRGALVPQRSARAQAAACGALGQLAADVPAVRAEAVDALLDAMRSGPFRVRLAAIQALGRARDVRAIGALGDLHQTEPDGRLRRTAYEARAALAGGNGWEPGLDALRREIERLSGEAASLRARLERVEPAGS